MSDLVFHSSSSLPIISFVYSNMSFYLLDSIYSINYPMRKLIYVVMLIFQDDNFFLKCDHATRFKKACLQ